MKTKMITCIAFLTITLSGLAQELTKDMYLAIKNDNTSALKSQLQDNALNNCYTIKETAYGLLALSAKAGAIECFDMLLNTEGIDVTVNCTGKTPLLYAAKYGHLEMVKKLVAAGADTSYSNKGKTALDYAKKYEHEDVINYLMEH